MTVRKPTPPRGPRNLKAAGFTNGLWRFEERDALAILRECPTGATAAALQSSGVSQATLDRLVERGTIEARKRTLANPRGLVVIHYYARSPR